MEKIKVGIVGLGQRGRDLTKTVLCCEEVEVVALCELYEDRLANIGKLVTDRQGKAPTLYEKYEDMLADERVGTVLICSSWDEHIRMAIQSMRAGKITAMEIGCAYDVEECWELVRAYEETKVPFMMLENCCFDRFELLTTGLARAGRLGEIAYCHGAYRHDLREEVLGGYVNRHYRLDNYKKRNCENYPTHELGPIAKLLDINRGNRMLTLSSFASKSVGLHAFSCCEKNPDKSLVGQTFAQGDVITTTITCANGELITLTLNTTLPTYYSRELTVHGTKGMCMQETNTVFLDGEEKKEEWEEPFKVAQRMFNNAGKYEQEYLVKEWTGITDEERELGHGGMDYIMLKRLFKAILNGEEMPIDVYDAAAWLCISALSEQSIAQGGAVQAIPDFTRGKWIKRNRLDVLMLPKTM